MFDLTGVLGGSVNPLLVWLVTATGGVSLLLLLVRRSRHHESGPNGLFPAAAPTGTVATVGSQRPPPGEGSVKADPARTFDMPAKGADRARVGYRQVRVSSKPDAVRSVELGRLDRGDEVEILDSFEGFLQVRTPDDITGWILRHTLVGAPTV
jgi:hypothetical protein